MPNRKLMTYEHQLQSDLKETAENVRDFFFTSGNKLVKILEPAMSWRGKETSCIWGDDPIHPTEKAYELMADGMVTILRGMESGARKRPRTNSYETGFSARSPHLNRSQHSGSGSGDGLQHAQRVRSAAGASGARAGPVAAGRRRGN
jgi:hypothetical protein